MNTQPIWSTNGIIAFVSALIALGVAFGLQITADQKIAIVGAVAVIAPLIAAAIANPKVTPLAAPRDETGAELVRKVDGQPTHAAYVRARGLGNG